MSDRLGYIYKLTSPSGKSYIGQTIQEPPKRFSKHKTKAFQEEGCRALSNAIRKYGWENFTIEIIDTSYEWDLDFLECEYIEMYDTFYPNGYNLTKGGRGGSNTLSEDVKNHMSQVAIYESKRVYERKNDCNLPRCIQKWRNSYRVEMNVDRKRVHKCFNITKYGDKEALRLAKEYVISMRPGFSDRMTL
jgi:group I intron endonuclease